MSLIQGKEKAWNALVNGGFVTTASTLALYLASLAGAVSAPDEAAIVAAITGGVASFAAAIGAYLATNSQPTNISVPAEPIVHPDDFTSTPKE